MIYSQTFPKDTPMCCERCVWGKGEHASWCEKGIPCPDCSHRLDTPPGCAGRTLQCGCGRWYPLDEGFMIMDSEKYRAYLSTLPKGHPHLKGGVIGYDSMEDYIAGVPSKPKRKRVKRTDNA